MKDINQYLLTSSVTVGDAISWMNLKDEKSKEKLLKLISHRFHNRYVKHARDIDSGFLKMGVSCFMIETLESFKRGKKDTKGIGAKMFKSFFVTEEKHFLGFKEIHNDFYQNVRCGILHQAETKNGWRIMLTGNLLNTSEKAINAKKFVFALEKSMGDYIFKLREKPFTDILWKNAFLKIKDICDNCNVTS